MAQLGFELTTSATPPSTALSVTSTDCAIETTPLKDCSNIYIYIPLEPAEGETKVCGQTGYRTQDL